MTVIFKNRTITSGYVLAKVDLSSPIPIDPCLYFAMANDISIWTTFPSARIFTTEDALAIALENIQMQYPQIEIIPLRWQANISTVRTPSFSEKLELLKREKALAKLNKHDLVALGITMDTIK